MTEALRQEYLGKLSVGSVFRFMDDTTEYIVTDQTSSSTRTYYHERGKDDLQGSNTMTRVFIVQHASQRKSSEA